jgi:hypothetical protein
LGIELEYESPESTAKDVYNALKDHVVLKRDGSLDGGFEIVSAPASMNIHLEQFKNFMFENQVVRASCGMHVHVDKAYLTALQIGKIQAFMYNASNAQYLTKIAGRNTEGHSYANTRLNRTFSTGYVPRTSYKEKGMHRTEGNHGVGLNISSKGTIEFRIFSSPNTFEDFRIKLEFVRALVEYCSPAAVDAPLELVKDYKTFLGWLKHQRRSYPSLHKTIKEVV